MSNEFTCVGMNEMFKKMYLSQIFNWNTSWEVKKIAIQSLWIMKFNKLGV